MKPSVYIETSVISYLTWNCKHIANATKRPLIEAICEASGYRPPIICTPEELRGDRYVD